MDIKSKLQTTEIALGSWLTLAHPAIAEIMAKAGFDWLAIDLEHSVITIREAEELIRVIDLCGVSPLVRLTSNNADQIKRVMDAGAYGVIVPCVNTKAQAQQAIQSVYYPLKGHRGVGLARAQGYGNRFNAYQQWMQSQPVVIVQIEHIDALNNLDEIFSLPEIDGYIIGPYDLTASMGIAGQFNHAEYIKTVNQIKQIASQYSKVGGIHIIEPDLLQLQQRVEEGFRFIAYSLDIRMLATTSQQAVQHVTLSKIT